MTHWKNRYLVLLEREKTSVMEKLCNIFKNNDNSISLENVKETVQRSFKYMRRDVDVYNMTKNVDETQYISSEVEIPEDHEKNDEDENITKLITDNNGLSNIREKEYITHLQDQVEFLKSEISHKNNVINNLISCIEVYLPPNESVTDTEDEEEDGEPKAYIKTDNNNTLKSKKTIGQFNGSQRRDKDIHINYNVPPIINKTSISNNLNIKLANSNNEKANLRDHREMFIQEDNHVKIKSIDKKYKVKFIGESKLNGICETDNVNVDNYFNYIHKGVSCYSSSTIRNVNLCHIGTNDIAKDIDTISNFNIVVKHIKRQLPRMKIAISSVVVRKEYRKT